jgi:Xaa-Pro dipeptidase
MVQARRDPSPGTRHRHGRPEWPYLVRGNPTRLKPEMTFSDEPGIYIREEFGIRLQGDMHITENGAELFTPQSPSLENPFEKAIGLD